MVVLEFVSAIKQEEVHQTIYLPFHLSLYLVEGNFFLLLHNTFVWMLLNMARKLYFANCTGKDT